VERREGGFHPPYGFDVRTSVPTGPDDKFYARADQFIRLANEQLDSISRGKVSASFMFAQARFAAWVSACGFSSGAEMKEAKSETMDYFMTQFRANLEENLDDYINKFATYMKQKPTSE
jgi:hypothetical protein